MEGGGFVRQLTKPRLQSPDCNLDLATWLTKLPTYELLQAHPSGRAGDTARAQRKSWGNRHTPIGIARPKAADHAEQSSGDSLEVPRSVSCPSWRHANLLTARTALSTTTAKQTGQAARTAARQQEQQEPTRLAPNQQDNHTQQHASTNGTTAGTAGTYSTANSTTAATTNKGGQGGCASTWSTRAMLK